MFYTTFSSSLYAALSCLVAYATFVKSDVVELTQNNFKEQVWESSDAWIVHISSTSEEPLGLAEQAENFLGILKIGKIDYNDFTNFLKFEDVHSGHFVMDNFRIYPYGISIHKQRKWENVAKLKDGIAKALKTIPDTTEELSNEGTKQHEQIKNVFQKSYAIFPPKFPLIYMTNEDKTPVFYRSLANKFSDLFVFGNIKNPSFSTLATYQLYETPQLALLLIKEQENQKLSVATVVYRTSIHGDMTFKNVARFLYLVHNEYFKGLPSIKARKLKVDLTLYFKSYFEDAKDLFTLPSKATLGTKETPTVKRQSPPKTPKDRPKGKQKEGKLVCRNENTNICLFFLSKRQDTNFTTPDIKDFLEYLKTQGKVIESYQMDLPCSENFELEFDLDEEEAPAVLIVLPKQRLFTISAQVVTSTQLIEFLKVSLTGNILHRGYDELPRIRESDCLQEIFAKDVKQTSREKLKSGATISKTEL